MTENEAIKEIEHQICNENGFSKLCHDKCMYGEEKCTYSMAIKSLEEIQHYRSIGTVEECQEAVGKQRAEIPLNEKELRNFHEQIYSFRGDCPKCKTEGLVSITMKYCPDCGQKIDWSEDK